MLDNPCALYYSSNGITISMVFNSARGRAKFMEKWPEIEATILTFVDIRETVHPEFPEMSTPQTEQLPFVAP
jgi:hypothetical protein